MSDFFSSSAFSPSDITLRLLGPMAPWLVNAVYPMAALTKFHAARHLPGLTGRWMDTGATALGGAVRGPFHRLAHGHHMFGDGFKVLVNPELKFGHFLHHLGLDSLTKTGIPNPLLPKFLGEKLLAAGVSTRFVREFMTLNVPKVLGGGLSLVCSGRDVFLAFSDAIPHTFAAAGAHFAFGLLDLAFGMFPPNFLMLSSAVGEMSVAALTAYRAWVDPVLPTLGVPLSVYLPALGHSVLLGSLVTLGAALFSGRLGDLPKAVLTSAAAGFAGTTAAFASAGTGFLAPFLGPLAGVVAFLLARDAVKLLDVPDDAVTYRPYASQAGFGAFSRPRIVPCVGVPPRPLGMLTGDRLLLDEGAIRERAMVLSGNH